MATYNTLGATSPFPAEGLGALDAPTPAGAGAYGAPAFMSESRGYPGQTVATGRRYSFTLDPERERQLQGRHASQMSHLDAERSAMFDYLSDLDAAKQRGASLSQEALGRGISAATGQGGRVNARMLRQAALEGNTARSQWLVDKAAISGQQAEVAGSMKALEREEAEWVSSRIADYQGRIGEVIAQDSDFFSTDTRAAASKILAWAATETNPAVRAYLIEQAERIRSRPLNKFDARSW